MADYPTAAVNRLSGYNGARYDAQTNPLGMAIGGHRVNFPASLNDSASVAAYMAATSQEVKDAATAVAANLTASNSARALAQAWASRGEDQVVSGGLFSSFHYAMKAAASATAAQLAQASVENTRDNMLRKDGAVLAQGASLVSLVSAGSISDAGVFAAQLAAFRNGSANGANGAIVFKAPSTLSTVMARFIVEGHNWSGDHVFTINATAYRTTGAFSSLRKLMLGTLDIDVRFALTPDGRMALILGDVSTQWAYINLSVSAMFSQQSRANLLDFSKGWTTEVVTNLSGYTQLTNPISNTLPAQIQSELNTRVPDTRVIAAGNGLTGGGNQQADRTITLGTPGTLTATTSNAVQTAGHTHNVDAASIASVGNAGLAVGTVGSFALLRHINNAAIGPGVDANGASLRYASAAGGTAGSPTPAGTWRCLGFSGGGEAVNSTTLFLRIA